MERKVSRPDANASKFFFGGHVAEIPLPRRRLYPKLKKRPVKVEVHKYYGIGKHYFVSVEEEDNPLWDSREQGWRKAWDDKKGKGRLFKEKFDYLWQAKDWAKKIIKKHFSGLGYEVKKGWDNLLEAERKTWFGNLKEGD